jgi:protocatechuate 3,4-dioxygenase beta subunit
MAGQTKMLLVLGGVLAIGIGAAVWAFLGEPATEPHDAGTAGVAPDGAPADSGTNAGAPKRPKKAGSASVVGFVRRSKGKVPVPGQEVQLLPERGDAWSVTTDAQGAFALTAIPHGGPYELRVAAEKCGTIRIPGIALDRNERRDVGTLWLDPSVKVGVDVRSWADAPVEGALVEAFAVAQPENFDWSKAYAQMAQAPISVARTTTDAAGHAVFPELATGRWTFTATKTGFARAGRANVTIRADADPPPVTLRLGTGHTLTGRVLSAAKAPVAAATVSATPPNAAWDLGSSALRARCTTDAEGRYSLESLEAGDVSLLVGRPGGAPTQVAAVRIPNVKQFDIVLGATATLAGAVTEKDGGKPVEGVAVRAWSYGAGMSTMAEGTTDAEGKYTLAVTEGTVSQVTAEKEGWVSADDMSRQQTQIAIREGETRTRDVQLRRGSKVSGVVKGPDGPLPGAKVWVHWGTPDRGYQQKSGTTDAEGRYEVTSLPPGTAIVRAEYSGFYVKDYPDNWWGLMQQVGPSPFKVDVAENGAATKDLEMVRGVAVSGRVEAAEGPLAGARVASPTDTEGGATSGEDGAFTVEGVKPGANVLLFVTKEGYAPSPANKPFTVSRDAPTTGIVLKMTRGGTVKGTVTATDGGPLVDARVTVSASGERGEFVRPMPYDNRGLQAVAVRPDGSYEAPLGGVSAGTFRVSVTALDRPTATSDTQTITEGRSEYVVNVTMDAGRDLSGRVVAKPGGAPVPDARVSLQARSPRGGEAMGMMGMGGQTVWAVTDAEGRFSVPHLAPSSYSVRASAEHYVAGNASVDLASANQVTVELEPELSIEGSVKFADGTPAEGANVQAARDQRPSADGGPMGGNVPGAQSWTVSGTGGRFRLTGLVAAGYRITVSPDWQGEVNMRQKTTDPVAAGTNDLKIVVEPGGVITGRVTDTQKKALAGLWVYVNPEPKDGKQPEGATARNARTKDDGTFTASGLGENATYQVVVRTSQGGWGGGTSTLRNATLKGVTPGTKGLEIVLEEGLTITGSVAGPDGAPLGSVYLTCTSGNRETGQQSSNTMTDGEGAFTFAGLEPGECSIVMQAWGTTEGFVIENGEKVPAGARDLRLVASKGVTISGTVSDERNAPVTNGSINATAKTGGRPRSGRVKENGTFELTGLSAGTSYKLVVMSPGRATARVDDVAAGAANVRIVMVKGLESAGFLRDEEGNPVKQGQIQFRLTDDPDIRTYAMTDDEGAFKAIGLAEGVYDAECMVRTSSNRSWRKCGTLKAGDAGVTLRIQP